MRRGRGRVGLGVLCSVAALSALLVLAPAAWVKDETLLPDPVEAIVDVDFSPTALPRAERRPIYLDADSTIRTLDGSVPPALEELILEFDRDSSIDAAVAPACELPGRGPRLTLAEIKAICRDAIVGGGRAAFAVVFPGMAPIPAATGLVIYPGRADRGPPTLYAVGDITKPVRTALVMPIAIRKTAKGGIGTTATVSVPKVMGGNATLTELRLRFRRRLPGPGERAGVVSLKCPDGEFLVRSRAFFPEGLEVRSVSPRTCRTKT